jgi:hypothetical protein
MDIIDKFEEGINRELFKGYASKSMFCAKSGKILDYKTVMKVTFDDGVKKSIQFFHKDQSAEMIKSINSRAELLRENGSPKITFDTLENGEQEINY